MGKRTQIAIAGIFSFVAGFVLINWFLLTGVGLMAGSWFVFDNLLVFEKHKPINWVKIAKRVTPFIILGFLADILLQV